MFISKAYAQTRDAVDASMTSLAAEAGAVADAPSTTEAFIWNMGLVVALMALFYLLLIRPQQRRFKEHSAMLDALKKGDKVVTGGGLIGKIDKLVSDEEVIVDLGNGMKVSALRSTIQGKNENQALLKSAANDEKPAAKKAEPKKAAPKKAPAKKATAKKSSAKK